MCRDRVHGRRRHRADHGRRNDPRHLDLAPQQARAHSPFFLGWGGVFRSVRCVCAGGCRACVLRGFCGAGHDRDRCARSCSTPPPRRRPTKPKHLPPQAPRRAGGGCNPGLCRCGAAGAAGLLRADRPAGAGCGVLRLRPSACRLSALRVCAGAGARRVQAPGVHHLVGRWAPARRCLSSGLGEGGNPSTRMERMDLWAAAPGVCDPTQNPPPRLQAGPA